MKKIALALAFMLCAAVFAQQKPTITFALITDTHISNPENAEDLRSTVDDINKNPDIEVVFIGGDVTEFGSDAEIKEAHDILKQLNKPWFAVPGNHDTKWSESGCNTFAKVFGGINFKYFTKGVLFIGNSSGPNMRMGSAQVPYEELVWLDSLVKASPKGTPIIYINHNPMDTTLSNWDQVYDILKQGNILLTLCGHGHNDVYKVVDGVPLVMGRSNLRKTKNNAGAGYNIVVFDTQSRQITFSDRISGKETKAPWKTFVLNDYKKTVEQSRPDYDGFNSKETKNSKVLWNIQEKSDIGSGLAYDGKNLFYATASGVIKAINAKNGAPVWEFKTSGRIYSFPYYSQGKVVCASTDGSVYCLDAKTGKKVWEFKTEKGIVACPIVVDQDVYVGSSAGKFYAIDLKNGKSKWTFSGIKSFIEARPAVDKEKIYIGSWGNALYALDRKDGSLSWEWNNGGVRMLSPAACFPVLANGRVFVTTPERTTHAIDISTGKQIWKSSAPNGRESQGISLDGKTLYIKTMLTNELVGVSTEADTCLINFRTKLPNDVDMDLTPAPVQSNSNAVFVPSSIGKIYAVRKDNNELLWARKLSNTVINHIIPLDEKTVVASTMDGKIFCIEYKL